MVARTGPKKNYIIRAGPVRGPDIFFQNPDQTNNFEKFRSGPDFGPDFQKYKIRTGPESLSYVIFSYVMNSSFYNVCEEISPFNSHGIH